MQKRIKIPEHFLGRELITKYGLNPDTDYWIEGDELVFHEDLDPNKINKLSEKELAKMVLSDEQIEIKKSRRKEFLNNQIK